MLRFRFKHLPCVLVVVVLVVLKPIRAEEPDRNDSAQADETIRQLIQAGDYPHAVQAINEALEHPDVAEDASQEALIYLKGRVRHHQGQYDAAIAIFEQVRERFPESPWAQRARVATGVTLAKKRDFRAAELFYQELATSLLSAERKQALAEIYLEFADAFFDPPNEDEQPDYEQAIRFYSQSLSMGPKEETKQKVQLLVARCHQKNDDTGKAAILYKAFVEDHPKAPDIVEARFRLGQCLMAESKPIQSRRVWRDLLEIHRDSDSKWVAEASFELSRTWNLPQPESDRELNLGVAALERFLQRFPTHRHASQAHLDIALSYLFRERSEEAIQRLEQLLADERYADTDEISQARNLLGKAFLTQKKFVAALASWRKYLAEHPADEQWSEVQRQIIDVEYRMGLRQFKSKEFDAARQLLGEFLAKYPLDDRNPGILFLFGQMQYEQKEWNAAITQWRHLVSKHPHLNASSFAQYMIAQVTEQELGKPAKAIEEYRKVTWGDHAGKARAAVANLTAKTMTLVTERVFRSDEIPTLKLNTRNIPSVTVRIYRISMESYFQKMHLAEAVESLDIALIDPDHTFEFEIPGYAKHREFENRIEVAIPNDNTCGAMAVTVSSKTHEATTLVIQSDLDIIVKSSRDEVFVFAENMRTGQPWPGVKLLVSDGQQILPEAVTGDDGVVRKVYPQLCDAQDVRVLAIANGHMASNVIDLKGIGVGQGLRIKGYIYSDRPAYRAGQRVFVRGCIRPVKHDSYVVEPDAKFAFEVFDPRNRVVWREMVTLGEFGSFHAEFPLPATSPRGKYRLAVSGKRGAYQGTFLVREYKLEPVRLTVHSDQWVCHRGEEITGTIRAEYDFGAPLVGREIVYHLEDEPASKGTTDEKGEVHFRYQTRDFPEGEPLSFKATLPEWNVNRKVDFYLADQAFTIAVNTIRDLFVAGESFEVTLSTMDVRGLPVGRELTLQAFELVRTDGEVAERLVEKFAINTVAKDGIGRQTIQLKNGGRYRLRATGMDRLGSPISGQTDLLVSGEEDQVRLRILTDRHTYGVGDHANITLHWRNQPALALVTFQGSGVLDYQLVRLETGANLFPMEITPELAPNFELTADVMTDARSLNADQPNDDVVPLRLHQANSEFTVDRALLVTISYPDHDQQQQSALPGKPLQLLVRTTDLQGNPVPAELSLALVERSLLEQFKWPMPPINQFFQGSRRKAAVRTTSSITFSYEPKTQRINPLLLTEQQRTELARQEAASRQQPLLPNFRSAGGMGGMGGGMGGMGGGFGGGFGGGMGGGFGGSPGHNIREPEDGSMAPFKSLIDLITGTVTEWEDVNGDSPVVMDNVNLSLVISQSQTLHEQHRPTPDTTRSGADRPFDMSETGYWNPAIVTGDDGTATITVLLPDRTTTWTWVAKGITAKTLAGEATLEIVVRKELFGQLKLPAAFTSGDRAEVIATIHNDAIDQGTIEVTLAVTLGTGLEEHRTEEKKILEVTEKGISAVPFKVLLERPGTDGEESKPADLRATQAVFTLTVSAAGQRDVVRSLVPIKPFGMTVYATSGGSADANTTAWVKPPASTPFLAPSLQVLLGPTIERSLLDVVFGTAPHCQQDSFIGRSGVERVTSDLLAAIGLQDLLGIDPVNRRVVHAGDPFLPIAQKLPAASQNGTPTQAEPVPPQSRLSLRESGENDDPFAPRKATPQISPEAERLDAQIRSSIGWLISAQNKDGGWGWTASSPTSDHYATARAVWAISLARRAGYVVPTSNFDQARNCLAAQAVALDNSDTEGKALLLHAQTVAGQRDFSLANRLYRERPSLSTAALLYLALSFAEMDREQIARELLDLVQKRGFEPTKPLELSYARPSPWSDSPTELRALFALATESVTPRSPASKQLVEWLLAHRTGHRWTPDKSTGPATLALSRWFGESQFQAERYRLTVWVNEHQVKTVEMDESAATRVIDVPAEVLVEGQQTVRFELDGRGRYTYQVVYSGLVPADQLKGTVPDWGVVRIPAPAPLQRDGREIQRGFSSILTGKVEPFDNPLTELPIGRRGLVELCLARSPFQDKSNSQREYLTITEPIPAGTTVIEQSIRGAIDRFEIHPGAITFFVDPRKNFANIQYELLGYLPGSYRWGPTVVRDAHRPERFAVAKTRSLTVLPSGSQSSDPYRLTPRELYELGNLAHKKRDLTLANKHLSELLANWKLKAKTYRHVVEMLLDINIDLDNAAEVVRYFEIIMERWPERQISFAKIVRVGTAYAAMDEFERSYLVFRATVESRFTLDSGIAGFLAANGEFQKSVNVMERLLLEYPPEPYVASAQYALAEQVSAKASTAAEDIKLAEAKITRVDLVMRAWRMLDAFLTTYPQDPAADEAAFSAANALLELDKYTEAAAASQRYADRYPKSDLLDSFWYIIGYSHFASGQHEQASQMFRKVADHKIVDKKSGARTTSPNKWPAIYILGQINHSLGKAADAIREYRLVEDRYPDAKKSIEYFLRKSIQLPEVTTARPGKPVEVPLRFRNVAACDIKVYRIDLMKFALLRRNLGGIAQINLAGIEPQQTATIQLGNGKDYRDRKHNLPLDLKTEGAYLVVCRGENLFASGLVLLTPLEVEVQLDQTSREVRATVKDAVADCYLHDVQVKIIGIGNNEFVSGSTDRRGLFIAQGITGAPTVIAQAGPGKYAFYRGQLASDTAGVHARQAVPLSRQAAESQMKMRLMARGISDTDLQPSLETAGIIVAGPGSKQTEQRIGAALNAPTALSFFNTTLSEVAQVITQRHRIPVRIDKRALDDAGLGPDTPVTFQAQGISLRSALRLMLHELGLTYVIGDETVKITTQEDAEQELATVVYPVADLVCGRSADGSEWADFDTLIELITSTVAPDTWDEVGGAGSIESLPYGNAHVLVLSQTHEVHDHVSSLLTNLRSVPGFATEDGKPPLRERPGYGEEGPFRNGMMGGMGGEMGGMGGGAPGSSQGAMPSGGDPAASPGLLRGLQDTKRRLQGQQVDKLDRMYKKGMKGGGVGMGGMF